MIKINPSILSKTVKVITPKTEKVEEAQIRGTIVFRNNEQFVQLDGAPDSALTPISDVAEGASDAGFVNGDRVLVLLKNHQAIVTKNLTVGLQAQAAKEAGSFVTTITDEGITAQRIIANDTFTNTLRANHIKADDIIAGMATIDTLDTNYAHITEGVIDNAKIGVADVNDLSANYAHITQGVIDNATIDQADVNNLDANYAHITQGVIDNAKIGVADINDLSANYAHITQGVIDNAKIGYADVNDLNAHYAAIDMANVNNAWIENGAIKKAEVFDENVFDLSGNRATIARIDASKINVANLRADNLVVRRINGQPVVGGYTLIDSNSSGYPSKNPKALGWYEFVNAQWVLSTDTTVDMTKAYYQEGNEVSLYDQAYIDALENDLQQQIDGAVETFTGSVVPTLVNYPYTDWYDTSVTPIHDERAKHVGDIYYVTNSTLEEDGYAYRFAFDETQHAYDWVLIKDSAVTRALADISELQTFESETTSWIDETDEGLETIRTNHTALSGVVDKTVKESVQLWFTKANTTAPSKPTAEVTSTSTAGNAWRKVVPAWNASYPNYYYCWQYKFVDGTFGWSDVVRDIAMGETQGTARDAKNTADAALPASTFTSFESTTFKNVKDTVDEQTTKFTNMTTRLGLNSDGTGANTDIVAKESALEQTVDGISTRVGKTEMHLAGMYATSSTAAGTAAKVATIVPALSNYELAKGAMVIVKFTAANTTASPTLNLNSTGAKAIKTYSGGNLTEAEYKWNAGTTFTFTYNGTNWLMQDSTTSVRMTSAETNITQNADSIKLEASRREMATNMLLDSDVSSLTKVNALHDRYWSDAGQASWCTPSIVELTDPPEQGIKYACRFVATASAHTNNNMGRAIAFYSYNDLDMSLPLKVGTKYTVSYWARCTSGQGRAWVWYAYKKNAAGTDNQGRAAVGITDLTSTWKYFTGTVELESETLYNRIWFYAYFPANTAGTVEICGMKLVAGDNVEAYSTTIEQTADNVLIKATRSGASAADKTAGGTSAIGLINVSPDNVKIQAKHVEIDGAAIFNNTDFQTNISGAYYKSTNITSSTADKDINNYKTTGIYHCATTMTNAPLTNHGTLIVEWNVGTKYQEYYPDNLTYYYKRTWNNSTSAWRAWSEKIDAIGAQATADAKKSIHTLTSSYSQTYSKLLEWSVEGHNAGNWDVTSTSGVKKDDTVRIKCTVSDMTGTPAVYVVGTVTVVDSATRLHMISHGLDTTIIDGGNILTNSIGANQIKSHAITANKISIGDYTNYITTTENDESSIVPNSGATISDGWICQPAANSNLWLTSVTNQWTKAGEKYRITGVVKAPAAGRFYLYLFGRDTSGTSVAGSTHSVLYLEANKETVVDEIITVSAEVAACPKINIASCFYSGSSGSTTQAGYLKRMRCERMQTIGGENLLLTNAGIYRTNYECLRLFLTEPLVAGQQYTLQFWGVSFNNTPNTNNGLAVYIGGGILQVVANKAPDSSGYWCATFVPTAAQLSTNDGKRGHLSIFNTTPIDSKTARTVNIDRWKLEKGGQGTDWSISPANTGSGENILNGTGNKTLAGSGLHSSGTFRASTGGTVSSLDISAVGSRQYLPEGINGAVRVTNNGSSATRCGCAQDAITGYFVTGQQYTISGWLRCNTSDLKVSVQPAWVSNSQYAFNGDSVLVTRANVWQYFSDTAVMVGDQSDHYSAGYVFVNNLPANAYFDVCGLKVEKGNKATGWSEGAEKKANTYITHINDSGIQIHPSYTGDNNYLSIDSNAISIYRANLKRMELTGTELAFWTPDSKKRISITSGTGVIVGRSDTGHALITDSGLTIFNSAGTDIAALNTSLRIGPSGKARAEVGSTGLSVYNENNEQRAFLGGDWLCIGDSSATRITMETTDGNPYVYLNAGGHGVLRGDMNGLHLYDQNNKERTRVDTNGLNIYDASGTSVASYSESARIGKDASPHVSIDANGFHIWKATQNTATNEVASFTNTTISLGKNNLASTIEMCRGALKISTSTSNSFVSTHITAKADDSTREDALEIRAGLAGAAISMFGNGNISIEGNASASVSMGLVSAGGFAIEESTTSSNVSTARLSYCDALFLNSYDNSITTSLWYENHIPYSGSQAYAASWQKIGNDYRLGRSSSSSRRYKEDIQPVTDDRLDPHRLYDIEVVQFKFKEGYFEQDDPYEQDRKDVIGFIAEDVYEHYPQAAIMLDDDVENWDERYIIPPMLKLIQEQNDRITELERRLS